MALARASLVAIMAGELREPLSLAGLDGADTTGHLKEPIDRTFRALGVAEDALTTASVATGLESAAIAYATYFVFARLTSAVADQVNLGSAGARADLHQIYDNMKDRMNDALTIAQGFGLVISGESGSGIVPIPYVGGIDAGDYGSLADDTSILPPLFSLRQIGVRGTT